MANPEKMTAQYVDEGYSNIGDRHQWFRSD